MNRASKSDYFLPRNCPHEPQRLSGRPPRQCRYIFFGEMKGQNIFSGSFTPGPLSITWIDISPRVFGVKKLFPSKIVQLLERQAAVLFRSAFGEGRTDSARSDRSSLLRSEPSSLSASSVVADTLPAISVSLFLLRAKKELVAICSIHAQQKSLT